MYSFIWFSCLIHNKWVVYCIWPSLYLTDKTDWKRKINILFITMFFPFIGSSFRFLISFFFVFVSKQSQDNKTDRFEREHNLYKWMTKVSKKGHLLCNLFDYVYQYAYTQSSFCPAFSVVVNSFVQSNIGIWCK